MMRPTGCRLTTSTSTSIAMKRAAGWSIRAKNFPRSAKWRELMLKSFGSVRLTSRSMAGNGRIDAA